MKSILNYKKPAFWAIVIGIFLGGIFAIWFLSHPVMTLGDELGVFIDGQICEHHYAPGHTGKNFIAVHHKPLGVKKNLRTTTVYLWVLYQEYSYANGEIKEEAGAHTPTVITVKRTGTHGHYELVEYWTPRDGSYYAKDIRAKFPWYLHGKALDSQLYIDEQEEFCDSAAEEYFKTESYPKIGKDSKVKDIYKKTPTDVIEKAYDNEEFVITKEHCQMDDGLWVSGDYAYLYRLEITGRMKNAAKDTAYIVLSNQKHITFEQTWRASGFSSNMDDYFDPAVAVIVGHKIF